MNLSTKDDNGTWTNWEEYFYIRNAQGEVIGLYDGNGIQVVSYTYDSWGKLISIKDGSDNDITNDTTSVGFKNPYRYRGYRYDNETSLYYLQSRYYNPSWGRFLNADAIIGSAGELLGHNLFSYCKNNVVNGKDPSGFKSVPEWADEDWEYKEPDDGKVEPYYPSASNLTGTVLGPIIGAFGNKAKEVSGYTDSRGIHFYPKTSIPQKITPYAKGANILSKAFVIVTTALDITHTWDPMVKMSLGRRVGKTAFQLAGVGAAIVVGTFISGQLLAAGMALGGGSAIAALLGAGAIDFAAGAAISYGQSVAYKKFGME